MTKHIFKDDKLLIDTSDLRLKWAADDLSNALGKLMDDFERIEDLQIAEDIVDLFKALQTYVRVNNEAAPSKDLLPKEKK